MISVNRIRSLLPHRYPMALVDRVVEGAAGEWLVAVKAISSNEPWYRNVPEGSGESEYDYPAVLLVESWCQAAGVLGREEKWGSGESILLVGVAAVRFHGIARPGDVVEHHVRLVRDFGESMIFEGETTCRGRIIVELGRVTVAMPRGQEESMTLKGANNDKE